MVPRTDVGKFCRGHQQVCGRMCDNLVWSQGRLVGDADVLPGQCCQGGLLH